MIESIQSALYADDPSARLHSARRWVERQNLGTLPSEAWIPAETLLAALTIEPGTYGAVNAWLLLVGPSAPADRREEPGVIPHARRTVFPVVCGRAHPHFYTTDPVGFFAKTRTWVTECFTQANVASTEEEALSLAMILHVPGTDAQTNAVRAAIRLARPRLVIGLTNDAVDLVLSTFPDARVSRPAVTKVGKYTPASRTVVDGEERFLLARAPNLPSNHHPIPETYYYLAHLVATARVAEPR